MNMTRKNGFVALLTVLALAAFSLSLVIAVTYLSIGESRSALALSQGEAALETGEGCAEDVLLESRRDENYTGGSYGYLGAQCEVQVAKDGTVWTLSVTSTKDGFVRSLDIIINRQPETPATITLQSWLEK